MTHQTQLSAFIALFESLTPQNVHTLMNFYHSDAYFKDPFNEVRGHAAILAIFVHMFAQVQAPQFMITRSIVQDNDAFITWNFKFQNKALIFDIQGSSHLQFGSDHRIHYHRDYWDTAEELYEKIPFLGLLMRILKKKARN